MQSKPFLWSHVRTIKNNLSQSGGQERITMETITEESSIDYVDFN